MKHKIKIFTVLFFCFHIIFVHFNLFSHVTQIAKVMAEKEAVPVSVRPFSPIEQKARVAKDEVVVKSKEAEIAKKEQNKLVKKEETVDPKKEATPKKSKADSPSASLFQEHQPAYAWNQPKEGKRRFEFHIIGGLSTESFYDSRQVFGSRHDELMFVPLQQKFDNRGLDINDKDQFNMLGFRTCIGLHVKGPQLWGAKTSAIIEGEFNGLASGDVNDPNVSRLERARLDTTRLFRLERAHFNFAWRNTNLLVGHYYHPLVLDEMFPETISRAHGRGYDPFDWHPQIKLRHRMDNFEGVLAVSKRFYDEAARLATTPDLFAQLNFHINDQHILGAGINYHVQVPRIATDLGYKTTEHISSIYPFVFALIRARQFDIKARFTYLENGSIYDIIGSYAVTQRNEATDEWKLTNIRTLSFWTEFIYKKFSKVEPALFVGISKNIGAPENIVKGYTATITEDCEDREICLPLLDRVSSIFPNIDYMFILSPRIRVRFGNFTLGAEIEFVRAAFAKTRFDQDGWERDYDNRYRVVNSTPVSTFRFLLATFYHFDYIPFSWK